jgi:hypothetical protein
MSGDTEALSHLANGERRLSARHGVIGRFKTVLPQT